MQDIFNNILKAGFSEVASAVYKLRFKENRTVLLLHCLAGY